MTEDYPEFDKKPFRQYKLNPTDDDKKKAPLTLKLNDDDRLMIEVAQYMFNDHSKSGTVKRLASIGLKVLLTQLSVDDWHYLTRGDRVRLVYKRPDVEKFLAKGISNNVD